MNQQYLVTTEGLQYLQQNSLEDAVLYIGLIAASGFVGFNPGDTMVTHDWEEFEDYSETTRRPWTNLGSSGGYISNTPGATYTISVQGAIIGFFLTTDNVKGDDAGILIVEGLADVGSVTRAVGDVYRALMSIRYKSGGASSDIIGLV